jgi:DNA polymerase V
LPESESPPASGPAILPDGQSGGFPSPADDYLHRALDLNEHLVPHPTTTFFIQVQGNSMAADCVFDGDILVVDRASNYRDGHLVLAIVKGAFVLRKLQLREGRFWLRASADNLPNDLNDFELDESCEIWGRVTWSLTKH